VVGLYSYYSLKYAFSTRVKQICKRYKKGPKTIQLSYCEMLGHRVAIHVVIYTVPDTHKPRALLELGK